MNKTSIIRLSNWWISFLGRPYLWANSGSIKYAGSAQLIPSTISGNVVSTVLILSIKVWKTSVTLIPDTFREAMTSAGGRECKDWNGAGSFIILIPTHKESEPNFFAQSLSIPANRRCSTIQHFLCKQSIIISIINGNLDGVVEDIL